MSAKVWMTNLAVYRSGLEAQLSYILHRVTGLGILAFLIVHVLDTSTVFFFPAHYNHAIEIYQSVPFMISEIFLVFSVIYHGVNGARIAVLDLFLVKKWEIRSQLNSALWVFAIAILLWLPAAFIMGRSVLEKLGV